MKKLLVSLLVLAFCASAVADVAITATDEGGGHLKIKVAPTGGASVRGIALKLSNSNGAVIDATGDVTTTQFNTFIDYAYDNAGYAIGTGHAIADAAGAGVATLPASTFVLSAGYLDQGGNQAGVTVDSFFDITYTLTVNSTIAIQLDTLRGGIVGDNLGNVTVQASQVLAAGVVTCRDKLTTTEQALYDRYVAAGKDPALTWCTRYHCWGDASNSEESLLFAGMLRVFNADLNKVIQSWKLKPETGADPAADVTHSEESLLFVGNISVFNADLNRVIQNWKKTSAQLTDCPTYLP